MVWEESEKCTQNRSGLIQTILGSSKHPPTKPLFFIETELALANFSTCKAGQIQKVSWFSAQLLKSDLCSIFGGKIWFLLGMFFALFPGSTNHLEFITQKFWRSDVSHHSTQQSQGPAPGSRNMEYTYFAHLFRNMSFLSLLSTPFQSSHLPGWWF